MAGYAVKRIDDLEAVYGGVYKRARADLGVESFGMQVFDLPPNVDRYPEHDHANDGQEEVYIPLGGRGEIDIEGERIALEPGVMVRVSPGTSRKVYTRDEPIRLLILGGVPGKVYEPPEISKLGAPDPLAQQAQ